MHRLVTVTAEHSYPYMDIAAALLEVTSVPEQLDDKALYDGSMYLRALGSALHEAGDTDAPNNEDVKLVAAQSCWNVVFDGKAIIAINFGCGLNINA